MEVAHPSSVVVPFRSFQTITSACDWGCQVVQIAATRGRFTAAAVVAEVMWAELLLAVAPPPHCRCCCRAWSRTDLGQPSADMAAPLRRDLALLAIKKLGQRYAHARLRAWRRAPPCGSASYGIRIRRLHTNLLDLAPACHR